jgi:diguanylate cyclase (GGDEF)-like protein/PAS domain S-box-containing protein
MTRPEQRLLASRPPLISWVIFLVGLASLALLFLRLQADTSYLPAVQERALWSLPDVVLLVLLLICLGLFFLKTVPARKTGVEAVLLSTISASPVGIGLLTSDGTIEWANNEMARIAGLNDEELSSRDLRSLFETEGEYSRLVSIMDDEPAGDHIARVNSKWVRKGKQLLDVHLSLTRFDHSDPYSKRIITVEDISDRKRSEQGLRESEQRYRMAMENSSDALALIENGRYTYVNQPWLDMFGYESLDEVVGRHSHIMVHPKDRGRVSEYMRMRKAGQHVPPRYELLGLKKNGVSFDVEASVSNTAVSGDKTYFVFLRDMSARRAAESALRENKLKLSDAMELARIVYWEADPSTIEYTFNDAFYSLLATSVEQEGGYTMQFDEYLKRFVHPEDVETVANRSAEVLRLQSQQMVHIEHRVIRRDGSVMHVVSHARRVRDKDGHTLRIYGVNQDITERKQAENALRESENKFRDLSEKSIVGIYLIQRSTFAYVNSRFANIHGYDPEEIIDKKRVEELIVPEDAHKLDRRGDIGPGGFQLEFRILTKNGEVRTVEVYGTNTSFRGSPAIIGTLVDVTERKQTEESLRWKTAFLEAQVNSSLDGILVIDTTGRTILQNQRTIDMWKLPRDIVEEQDRKRQLKHVIGMAKQPRRLREQILRLHRHPDETGRYEIELKTGVVLDTYSCPVVGRDKRHYGRIWTFRDITELRHYWNMLENLSATDGLTELPNRRRFDEFLGREWRRSLRDQSLLSLILMDIDYFKEFNDHYGHLAGDDCLRQVASVLDDVIKRPGDLAARYGGEEFACVLPETDARGAMSVAEKIREQLDLRNILHGFSSAADHITLSFGVATVVPQKGQNQSNLIDLADKLMYSAKQEGRHRIRSWRQPSKGRKVNAR